MFTSCCCISDFIDTVFFDCVRTSCFLRPDSFRWVDTAGHCLCPHAWLTCRVFKPILKHTNGRSQCHASYLSNIHFKVYKRIDESSKKPVFSFHPTRCIWSRKEARSKCQLKQCPLSREVRYNEISTEEVWELFYTLAFKCCARTRVSCVPNVKHAQMIFQNENNTVCDFWIDGRGRYVLFFQ